MRLSSVVQRRCSYRRIRCSNQLISAKPSPSQRSPAPRHFPHSKLPLCPSSLASPTFHLQSSFSNLPSPIFLLQPSISNLPSPIFLLQSSICSPLLRVLCAL